MDDPEDRERLARIGAAAANVFVVALWDDDAGVWYVNRGIVGGGDITVTE